MGGRENLDSTTFSDGKSEKDSGTSIDSKQDEEFLKLVPRLLVVERTGPIVWSRRAMNGLAPKVALGVNAADKTGRSIVFETVVFLLSFQRAIAGTRGAIRFVLKSF